MSNILNINELVNLIPIILEYFAPGFLFLVTFCYFTSRHIPSNILAGSVVISYVLKSILCAFYKIQDWNIRAIVLCIVALIISVLFVLVTERRWFNKIFTLINHKSIHDDIFSDVVDYKNGTTVKIICEQYTYIGKLLSREEKGNDSWVALVDYTIESKDETFESTDIELPSVIMVKMSDIKHICLYYNEKNDVLN